MATLEFSDNESKFDFELDLNEELFKMNKKEYLRNNLKIIPKMENASMKDQRLELISKITELWQFLDDEDKQEVIEIAKLMRKGEWVKGSILQWEKERGGNV